MTYIDGHSHILPNVDDGSPSIEYSKKMLEACSRVGITHLLCTPHIHYPWGDVNKIAQAYSMFRACAADYDVEVELGYEVYWADLADIGYKNAHNYTLGESNLFLLEFSFEHVTNKWESIVSNLQAEGLDVIIAHPERYSSVHRNFDIVKQFKDAGCLLMCSANFLDKSHLNNRGRYKSTVKKMLKANLVDMIASDAHRVERFDEFLVSLDYAQKYGFDAEANNQLLSKVF